MNTVRRVRIFISSPGDVAEEREKARAVVEQLQRWYGERLRLQAMLWEDLPLQADASFQDGIDVILSDAYGIDIAVFILWSRLGSPVGGMARKADGSPYRSGTERELDLVLAARERSGGQRPDVVAYVRNDESAFHECLRGRSTGEIEALLDQRKLAEQFIREKFQEESGENTRAYHTYPAPITFAERLKVHLRALLDARLNDAPAAVLWTDAPYRGLEVFDVDHISIFHGRELEIARLTERLRERVREDGCGFVVIVGASGSGKSSLARAGVAASLLHWNLDDSVSQWRYALLTPLACEGDLLGGLIRALDVKGALPELRGQVADFTDLRAALASSPSQAVALAIKPAFHAAGNAAGGAVRLLLVLDQMEELYTDRRIGPGEREAFLKALAALAGSGFISILATLRSDFYALAQKDEAFLRLKGETGHFDLLPPGAAALRQLIVEPAHLTGLHFEKNDAGCTLDARLIDDALRQPDALPLVEYTLRELYEARTADGTLSFAAYKVMGGIEGAIGHRAEAVFVALDPAVQDAFDDVAWSLVTVDPGAEAAPVRRRALMPAADDASARATLLRTLVAERFLTADRAGPTEPGVVFLAHEALFHSWPRLVKWTRDNRDLLRIRRRVEAAARLWHEKGKHPDYLLAAGLPLAEGESLLASQRLEMEGDDSRLAAAFIRASIETAHRAARRRALVRRAAFTVISALAVVASFATVRAWREARRAEAAREDADDLNAYMLGDLREQLERLGRTDILDGAALRTQQYLDRAATQPSTAARRTQVIQLHLNLGRVRLDQGRLREAIDVLRAAADRASAAPLDTPDFQLAVAGIHAALCDVLARSGENADGQQHGSQAVLLYRKLAAAGPEREAATLGLANCLIDIGDLDRQRHAFAEAGSSYEESRALFEKLAAASGETNARRGLVRVLLRQADVSETRGDRKAELALLVNRAQVVQKFAADAPGDVTWDVERALGEDRFAEFYKTGVQLEEASAHCETALEQLQALTEHDQQNLEWRRLLATEYNRRGDLRLAKGAPADAEHSYRTALALNESLAGIAPRNLEWQRGLATSHSLLADALAAQDRAAEAAAEAETALALRRKLHADPDGRVLADLTRDLAVSLSKSTYRLMSVGDFARAATLGAEAVSVAETVGSRADAAPDARALLAAAVEANAESVVALERQPEGIALYRRALSIRQKLATDFPDDPIFHHNEAVCCEQLAGLLKDANQSGEARVLYKQALELRQQLKLSGRSTADWEAERKATEEALDALDQLSR